MSCPGRAFWAVPGAQSTPCRPACELKTGHREAHLSPERAWQLLCSRPRLPGNGQSCILGVLLAAAHHDCSCRPLSSLAYVNSCPGASTTGHLQATQRADLVPSPSQVLKYLVCCRPYDTWSRCQVLTSCSSKPQAAALHVASRPCWSSNCYSAGHTAAGVCPEIYEGAHATGSAWPVWADRSAFSQGPEGRTADRLGFDYMALQTDWGQSAIC